MAIDILSKRWVVRPEVGRARINLSSPFAKDLISCFLPTGTVNATGPVWKDIRLGITTTGQGYGVDLPSYRVRGFAGVGYVHPTDIDARDTVTNARHDITTSTMSMFVLCSMPGGWVTNKGMVGLSSQFSDKWFVWTEQTANQLAFVIRNTDDTADVEAVVTSANYYNGQLIGIVGRYDGANVSIYVMRYTDRAIDTASTANTGSIPSKSVPFTLGSYQDANNVSFSGAEIYMCLYSSRAWIVNEIYSLLRNPLQVFANPVNRFYDVPPSDTLMAQAWM